MDPITLRERASTAIGLGESHFREFKSGLHGQESSKKPRDRKEICVDIARTLVAFANADGGELLVGVEDNGRVTGLDCFDADSLETIERAVSTYVHPDTPLRNVVVARISVDDKTVLYFSVAKANEFIHHTSDGRCLQRRDLESVPIPAEVVRFERQETISQEYDRAFVEGPLIDELNDGLVRSVADQISRGMSAEKCLQYLGMLEHSASGVTLRKAALLLFAKEPQKWHPRLQLRIMKVEGTELGSGAEYNVSADEVVEGNVLELLENGWDALRPYLVQPVFGSDAKFSQTVTYPEHACREALVNAIAHRDYSQEGRGIEIYIYSDRMEVLSPGSLLSVISVEDLIEQRGVHHSRNGLIARVLRELGYMRELGEGIRRIFDLMRKNELAEPRLDNGRNSFSVTLFHKPIYNAQERLWLDEFSEFDLTREQRVIVLLGREGEHIAPKDIWESLGIVDTEHYRQIVSSLQELGILGNVINKVKATSIARRRRIPVKEVPRFLIRRPSSVVDKELEHRPDSVQDEPAESESRIWVGNLPRLVEKKQLFDVFSEFGVVQDLFVATYSDSGACRGFGFVEFEQDEAARSLLKAGEVEFGDRRLIIRGAKKGR